jgi:molybdopterin-binding protein
MIATITPDSLAELALERGSEVWLSAKAVDIRAYAI